MSPLSTLLILWGVVTGILAAVLIYRSLIAMKEDDQLFLSQTQSFGEQEQRQIQERLRRLAPIAKALTASSGVLLMASAGMWIAQELNRGQ